MEEWKEYKLGEVCAISSSKRIFANEYQNTGIPFYRGKEIIEKHNGANISNELFISEEKYNEIKTKFGAPKKGDMLLSSVGTLGVPYIVRDETFYFKDGNLTWFYNYKGINNYFLYYWFLSPKARFYIDTKAIGSTQKALTIETLKKFEIFLPSIDTQDKIVAILKSLDDKIEVNRKINENLEQQAQALFKSWFVDFEPFKNGEFVESEFGMIPKGWRVGTLDDLLEIKYGKDHKKLSDGKIPVYGSGGLMRRVDKSLYKGESVLIPRKGTLNNVMYVNEEFWTVDTMFYTIPKVEHIAFFCYLFLLGKDLASMNAGSAVPSMTTEILNSMPVVIPQNSIVNEFDNVISSYFRKIENNDNESRHLAELRDTLLPKLMSGELKVNEIEK